ncbi:CDP-alcohol phosphatidyltransferase family protein [Ferrimicrobium sp.]|uniref:CDP-alcohol phosphatidyltransferase family protein n=1 Tax=Ferrimicrobium sp. TaxID=2926050 RepID=UPI0026333CCA|nr:CDP-alcohol phosphatidyltransferase family protein [Ferrimicrobium sp.]
MNKHRLLTIAHTAIPSIITAIRVLLLIPVWILLSHGRHDVAAAILLAVMGITDFLDGYVARRTGAVTTFGKIFDPFSDRIVLIVVAVAALVDHLVPTWLLVIVLVREILVGVTVLADLLIHRHRNDVVWIGKAGTFGLLLGFPLVVLGDGLGQPIVKEAAVLLMTVAVLLLYAALVFYVLNFVRTAHQEELP